MAKDKRALILCGVGVSAVRHATLESLRVLRGCDIVFTLHRGGCGRLLKGVVDLNRLYHRKGVDPARTPEDIAQTVMASLRQGKRVGLIVTGSPLYFDAAADRLITLCRERKLPCEVYPAVSSFEAALAFLGQPVRAGLQIFEARQVLADPGMLNPRLHALLVRLTTPEGLKSDPAFFQALAARYPSGHVVSLIHLFNGKTHRHEFRRLSMADLAGADEAFDAETTLFIPAVEPGH
ncbi:MAG: SAM-dependent methyltransferase [Elusimicrobiota bacterium]